MVSPSPPVHPSGISTGRTRVCLVLGALVFWASIAKFAPITPEASSDTKYPSNAFPSFKVPSTPQRNEVAGAPLELRPRRVTLAGRDVLWQFPGGSDASACPAAGVLFLYHGCTRLASSFFYSPQGRDMLRTALAAGFAVVAFKKREEKSCWSRADVEPTVRAGRAWIETELVPVCGREAYAGDEGDVPLFGFGASSGGSFVATLAAERAAGSAEADDGGASMRFRAINVQIMAPRVEPPVPTIFTVMSRDDRTSGAVRSIEASLKEKGIPTKTLTTAPKPVTPSYFKDRFADDDSMTDIVSRGIYDDLVKMKAIDPEKGDSLVVNPRKLDLEPILGKDRRRPYGVSERLLKELTDEEVRDADELWIVEELNVAYDQHEITAEGFDKVLDFFLEHSP